MRFTTNQTLEGEEIGFVIDLGSVVDADDAGIFVSIFFLNSSFI